MRFWIAPFLRLIIDRERRNSGFDRRLKDDDPNVVNYDFYQYGSYPQMVSWMKNLARTYATFVHFIEIGKSHEGRAIAGVEVLQLNFLNRFFFRNPP